MLVYRIEKDGLGPWRSDLVRTYRKAVGYSGHDPGSMPNPYEDNRLSDKWIKLRPTADYYFGFASLDQLQLWFPEPAGRRAMADAGGAVAVYRVKPSLVLRGEYQVAFKRADAGQFPHNWISLATLQGEGE